MDGKVIKTQKRTILNSRENRRQRRLGQVPSSIIIKGQDSVPVLVEERTLKSALQKFGRAAILKLKADKDTYSVIVREIDSDPLTGNFLNVTFQQVSLSEEIKVNVAISIQGADTLNIPHLNIAQQLDTLPVMGRAADIPNTVEIDVSNLVVGDSVYVKDLTLPKGISVELDPDQLLLNLSILRTYQAPVEDTATTEETAEESAQ